MNLKTNLLALAAVLGLAAVAADTERTNWYPCFQAARAPQIDGNVADDPAWQTAPRVTGFRVLGGDYAHAKQTTAQMCWDAEAVYVAIVTEEPDTAQIKPEVRDGGWTWGEDSVEIFLQPKDGGVAFQFGVTAGGALGSGEGKPDIAKCKAAARIGPDRYSLELRVPFAVVGAAAPVVGTTWRGTFCRNIQATRSGGDKFTNWSPLERRFLEPENYAVIEFMTRTPAPDEANRLSEGLNRGYRTALTGQLAAAAARGAEFRDALAQAAQQPKQAAKAQALLVDWKQVDEVNRQSGSAPVLDLRRALMKTQGLAQASYEVKYTYLLDRLFEEK